jgi:hypothetical protein
MRECALKLNPFFYQPKNSPELKISYPEGHVWALYANTTHIIGHTSVIKKTASPTFRRLVRNVSLTSFAT